MSDILKPTFFAMTAESFGWACLCCLTLCHPDFPSTPRRRSSSCLLFSEQCAPNSILQCSKLIASDVSFLASASMHSLTISSFEAQVVRPKIIQNRFCRARWVVGEAVLATDLIRSLKFHVPQGGCTSSRRWEGFPDSMVLSALEGFCGNGSSSACLHLIDLSACPAFCLHHLSSAEVPSWHLACKICGLSESLSHTLS